MVRSHWMGPVFGVLVSTGLAWGQSTTGTPAPTERFVAVQEAGKAPQRCKVLKTWTEADGTPAYQAQDVETGELMTIEESSPAVPKSGLLAKSSSMRIFHWGRGASVPAGTPEPPIGAVVVGAPVNTPPTQVASAPPPAKASQNAWPSAFVTGSETVAARATPHAASVTTVPTRRVDLTPVTPTPVVASPVKMEPVAPVPVKGTDVKASPAVAASEPNPAPPAVKPPPGPAKTTWIVKEPKPEMKPLPAVVPAPLVEEKPAPPSPYTAVPAKPAPAAALAPAKAVEPKAAAASPYAAAPASAAPPKVADKAPVASPYVSEAANAMEAKHAPVVAAAPGKTAEPKAPVTSPYAAALETKPAPAAPPAPDSENRFWVVSTPWKPTAVAPPTPPVQAAAAPPKFAAPHAAPRADDPLKTPDKYAKMPHDEGFGQEKKAPLLAALALGGPPATLKADAKAPETHAAPAAPALPPLPGPAPVPPPAPPSTPVVLQPSAPKTIAAAPVELKPAAPKVVATAPVELKPAAPSAPAVPVGMKSVAAASSPELAPAPQAAAAGAPDKTAMGVRADEPNAFSERPKGAAVVAASANAFSAPAAAAPPDATPPAAALAMNAFAAPPAAAPGYAQQVTAMRPMTPLPTAARQMPAAYVVPAGYHQEGAADLPKLTAILRESLFPSQREWAAESLASMDWRRQPEIVDLLVERAKQDPAPTVRAECVRSLGRIKADAPAAVEAVKSLQSDSDDRVRQAAVEAHAEMTGAASSH